MAHTPAPWNYEDGWLYSRGVSPTGMGYTDTVLKIDDATWQPTKADARLIAAAPDLLEALQALQRQALQSPDLISFRGQEALELAAAAIAKAEGR
jgi:hypothetical protein